MLNGGIPGAMKLQSVFIFDTLLCFAMQEFYVSIRIWLGSEGKERWGMVPTAERENFIFVGNNEEKEALEEIRET